MELCPPTSRQQEKKKEAASRSFVTACSADVALCLRRDVGISPILSAKIRRLAVLYYPTHTLLCFVCSTQHAELYHIPRMHSGRVRKLTRLRRSGLHSERKCIRNTSPVWKGDVSTFSFLQRTHAQYVNERPKTAPLS